MGLARIPSPTQADPSVSDCADVDSDVFRVLERTEKVLLSKSHSREMAGLSSLEV